MDWFSENRWSSATSRAAHCFGFFSKVRAKAWHLSGTFLFTNPANLEPDLADTEQWVIISTVVWLRLFFCFYWLNFRLQSSIRLQHILQHGLSFHWLWLGIHAGHLVVLIAEERLSRLAYGFTEMAFLDSEIGDGSGLFSIFTSETSKLVPFHICCANEILFMNYRSLFIIALSSGFGSRPRCDYAWTIPKTTQSTAKQLCFQVGLSVHFYMVEFSYRLICQYVSSPKLSAKNRDN